MKCLNFFISYSFYSFNRFKKIHVYSQCTTCLNKSLHLVDMTSYSMVHKFIIILYIRMCNCKQLFYLLLFIGQHLSTQNEREATREWSKGKLKPHYSSLLDEKVLLVLTLWLKRFIDWLDGFKSCNNTYWNVNRNFRLYHC